MQDLVYVKYNQKLNERFNCEEVAHAIDLDEFIDDSEWVLGEVEPFRRGDDEDLEVLDEEHWKAVSDACGAEEPSTNVVTRREARAKTSTSRPSSSSARPSAKDKGKGVAIIDDEEEEEFNEDESDEEEEEVYVDEESGEFGDDD